MTRTNVVLDDELVEKCLQATGIKTRRGLIDYALQELLRRKNQKKALLHNDRDFCPIGEHHGLKVVGS